MTLPDRLAGDAARLRRRQAAAITALVDRGYEEVAVPMLEHADVFCTTDSLRFVDRRGHVVGLRADFTGPLARVVATRLADVPNVRLCYRGTTFRDSRRAEVQQAGFELFGDGSLAEDIETIRTAVEVARTLGYDPVVSVGAVGQQERLPAILAALGDEVAIRRDAGEVPTFDYYSGVVFGLYAPGVPGRLGGGGRYDTLVGRFGTGRPAIGASFDLDAPDQRARRRLTVAFPKGRLMKPLLERLGADAPRVEGRELRVEGPAFDALLVKNPDIPTYVESGAADVGIVGLDQTREQDRNVLRVGDTGLGRCRMSLCGLPGTDLGACMRRGRLKVASKYPQVASRALKGRGVVADIIPLQGSVELAVVAKLADAIVDLVETGATLRANGLVELETLFESSAVVIVNPASWRLRTDDVKTLVRSLT